MKGLKSKLVTDEGNPIDNDGDFNSCSSWERGKDNILTVKRGMLRLGLRD